MGLEPLARIVPGNVGLTKVVMMRRSKRLRVLKKTGWSMNDVDLIELNEFFAIREIGFVFGSTDENFIQFESDRHHSLDQRSFQELLNRSTGAIITSLVRPDVAWPTISPLQGPSTRRSAEVTTTPTHRRLLLAHYRGYSAAIFKSRLNWPEFQRRGLHAQFVRIKDQRRTFLCFISTGTISSRTC